MSKFQWTDEDMPGLQTFGPADASGQPAWASCPRCRKQAARFSSNPIRVWFSCVCGKRFWFGRAPKKGK